MDTPSVPNLVPRQQRPSPSPCPTCGGPRHVWEPDARLRVGGLYRCTACNTEKQRRWRLRSTEAWQRSEPRADGRTRGPLTQDRVGVSERVDRSQSTASISRRAKACRASQIRAVEKNLRVLAALDALADGQRRTDREIASATRRGGPRRCRIALRVHLTPEIVTRWGGPGRVRDGVRIQGNRFLALPRPNGVVLGGPDRVLLLGRPVRDLARLVRATLERKDPDAAQRLCGPGTRLGDLAALSDDDAEHRWAAATRLAKLLKPTHKSRRVRDAVRRLAAEQGRPWRDILQGELLPKGFLQAARESAQPNASASGGSISRQSRGT